MEWNISGSSSRFPADFEHFYNLNPVTKYLAMFPAHPEPVEGRTPALLPLRYE
jgi:hypothetical protein